MPLFEEASAPPIDSLQVHSLQGAIKSLKLSKPPRTLGDFWNILKFSLVILTGFLFAALSYIFFRRELFKLTTLAKGTAASRLHVTTKNFYNQRLMWILDSNEKHRTGCYAYEKQKISCDAQYSLDACIEMQAHYCNYRLLVSLIENIETFSHQKEFIACTVGSGVLLALCGLQQLLNAERKRLRFKNAVLNQETVDDIKTIARQMKIDFAKHATIDDLIAAFNAKLDALTTFKLSNVSQGWFFSRKASTATIALDAQEKEMRMQV